MRTALVLAAIGGIIVFAVNPSFKVSWLSDVNIHAAGWVMFLVGIGFAIAYSTPHYHRWRNRE